MYMFNTDIFKENLKEFYSYILNVIVIIGKTIFWCALKKLKRFIDIRFLTIIIIILAVELICGDFIKSIVSINLIILLLIEVILALIILGTTRKKNS